MIRSFSRWLLPVIALSLAAPSPASAARKKRKGPLMALITRKLDETLVAEPKDSEVCFSPDEPCDIKLVKFVDSAQKSIDVAIFDINLDQLVHHLLLKAKAIPVRIVVDKRQAKGEHSLVPTLIKGGATVRYGRQRGIMHNKFVVVDGKRMELGSFNYTNHAATANQENQAYLAEPGIVERYKKRFDRIWETATPAG